MQPKKKDHGSEKAAHFANKAGRRWKDFAADARSGRYDGARLAGDVAGSIMDAVDLWAGLLGFGASPSVGVAELSAKSAVWQAGESTTVRLEDPLPDGASFANTVPAKLRTLDGATEVDLKILAVRVDDDDDYVLHVDLQDTGGGVAAGEYSGNLLYEDANGDKQFACLVRGIVEP